MKFAQIRSKFVMQHRLGNGFVMITFVVGMCHIKPNFEDTININLSCLNMLSDHAHYISLSRWGRATNISLINVPWAH